MSTLESQRAAFMAQEAKVFCGIAVTYRRGTASVDLTAGLAASNYETIDERGLSQRLDGRDWLIDAADLVLEGESTTPALGDRIEQTLPDGSTAIFEVQGLGGSRPWSWCDGQQIQMRVHTRLIEES